MANEDHVARLKQGIAAWKGEPRDEIEIPDLRGADLRGADLRGADLAPAHLSDANLRDADLRAARLLGADLIGANLNDATLRGAHLHEAYLGRTFLTNVDLSNAIGLDTCKHWSQSIIDHRTLEKSPICRLSSCAASASRTRIISEA